jgi:hypothetical protein
MKVKLSNVGNPDYGQDHEITSHKVVVNGIHKANYFLSKIDSVQKHNRI